VNSFTVSTDLLGNIIGWAIVLQNKADFVTNEFGYVIDTGLSGIDIGTSFVCTSNPGNGCVSGIIKQASNPGLGTWTSQTAPRSLRLVALWYGLSGPSRVAVSQERENLNYNGTFIELHNKPHIIGCGALVFLRGPGEGKGDGRRQMSGR
jgi:hypothetical protein